MVCRMEIMAPKRNEQLFDFSVEQKIHYIV